MIVTEKKVHCDSPKIVAGILQNVLLSYEEHERCKEHFYAIGLNNKNVVQYIDLVSIGTISETLVHPREVFRFGVMKGIVSIIISHNHPSGELQISREDIETTNRLKEAGKILGIPVLDHVVVTESDFLSMKEEGYL